MSRGGVESHDALALALAFFKAPGRFPDLLHGRTPLPAGMTELLQVAAGDPPEGALPPMFVSLPELQKAALFFIEQVLLARDADHYRVMGLAPGAGAEQIKEHHRLLMRLFHPDRRSAPDEQAGVAAARINRGYAVLRGAETRAAYYEAVQPAPAAAPVAPAFPRPVRVAGRQPRRTLPPAFRRHAPQIVLGAVGLVAIAGVAMVYVNRVPDGAIGAGALAEAPRGDVVAPVQAVGAPEASGSVGSGGRGESTGGRGSASRFEMAAAVPWQADPPPQAQMREQPASSRPRAGAAVETTPAAATKAQSTTVPVQDVAPGKPPAREQMEAAATGVTQAPVPATATNAPVTSVTTQADSAGAAPATMAQGMSTSRSPASMPVQGVSANEPSTPAAGAISTSASPAVTPAQPATARAPSAPVRAGTPVASPAPVPAQAMAASASTPNTPERAVAAQEVAAATRRSAPPAPVSARAMAGSASAPTTPEGAAEAFGRNAPAREEAPRRAEPAVESAVQQAATAGGARSPVVAAAAEASGATTAAEPPAAVLERFVVAYERGDLEGLMALFDEDARIERGGRARIRKDYEELFRASEMRSLRLRDVRWSGEGEVVRAEGAFVARLVRRGEDAMRNVAGSIRIELVRRGDRLLIIGLFHTSG